MTVKGSILGTSANGTVSSGLGCYDACMIIYHPLGNTFHQFLHGVSSLTYLSKQNAVLSSFKYIEKANKIN